jgi:hypothetical protein
MTMALCFACGATKFGALCPCPECQAGPTGNVNLDIAFSDHRMSVATIAAFGEVVRAIRLASEDEQVRFWSFIRFVSLHHSEILGVTLAPDLEAECDAVLSRASPPPVIVEESGQARVLREMQERNKEGKAGTGGDAG